MNSSKNILMNPMHQGHQSVIGNPNKPGKKVENYLFTRQLGKGAYGEVFQATHVKTNQIVAVKCVLQERLKENQGLVGSMLKTEISVLQECSNRNVVKLLNYMESQNQCYLVLEYCNEGDFEQLWEKKGRKVPERDAIQYLKQILNGMKGLHELNVIHRDLKLANILIHNGVLKIADLGFATQLESKTDNCSTSLGSLGNMAPEVLEGKRYGILVDMFSIGSILYQLLYGQFPFSTRSSDIFLHQVRNQPLNLNPNIQITDQSKQLLTRMLRYDPNERMKWTEIYEHPLIKDNNYGAADIFRPISLNTLINKKVDGEQNRNMYKEKEKQPQVNDENMFNMIKSAKPYVTQITPDQSQFDQDDQEFLKQLQQIEQQQEVENREIKEVMVKYFQLRNKYTFLPRTFECMQCLQHSHGRNVIFAGFLLMKKLIIESTKFIDAIDKKKNIFNTKYLEALYKTEAFMDFYDIIQNEQILFRVQFDEVLLQCQETISLSKSMDVLQKQEIVPEVTPNFDDVYKDVLLDYQAQLSSEEQKEPNLKIKLLKIDLQIHLLDCIQFDKQFDEKLKSPNFSFHNYFDEIQNMDEKQKQIIIEEKFGAMFFNGP